MNKKIKFKHNMVIGVLASIAFLPIQIMGQPIYLAGNYDGVNYDGSSYDIGTSFGYAYDEGASFTVAGTGDFDLTKVIMPMVVFPSFGSIPNPTPNLADFQVSIVSDNGGQPTGDIVGAFTPFGLGPSSANYAFDITGTVHGGMKYWLLCSLTAPDNGCIDWNLAWSPMYIGTGYVARRWSATGVPTGAWTISTGSGSVQPAFLIEGTEAVPEPKGCLVLALGIAGLITRGYWGQKMRKRI